MSQAKWEEAADLYITGGLSYNLLAVKYGVSKATIQKHGTKSRWPVKRVQYDNELQAKRLRMSANTRLEIDKKHLNQAQAISAVGNRLLMIGNNYIVSGDIDKGLRIASAATNIMKRGVSMERQILGLKQRIVEHVSEEKELKRPNIQEVISLLDELLDREGVSYENSEDKS